MKLELSKNVKCQVKKTVISRIVNLFQLPSTWFACSASTSSERSGYEAARGDNVS